MGIYEDILDIVNYGKSNPGLNAACERVRKWLDSDDCMLNDYFDDEDSEDSEDDFI